MARRRHRPSAAHSTGPVYVRVPVERLELYRLVLAAATALAHSLAHETVDDQALWLTRLRWAVELLPVDDRDYYLTYALAMEVEP